MQSIRLAPHAGLIANIGNSRTDHFRLLYRIATVIPNSPALTVSGLVVSKDHTNACALLVSGTKSHCPAQKMFLADSEQSYGSAARHLRSQRH